MRDETIEVLGRDEPFRFTVRVDPARPAALRRRRPAEHGRGERAGRRPRRRDRGNGYAVSLAWTALQPSNTADAVFEIDRATNWREFRAAATDFAVPSQNLVYADRAGNIGYQAPGRIPIRKSGNNGDYPALGWLPADDWTGSYVPFAALPSVLNPADGFVATANQAVDRPGLPVLPRRLLGTRLPQPADRDLLERKPRVSVADMSRIQLDTRNGFAPTFVPYLLQIFMPSQYLAGGQRLLQGWDFRQGPNSAAAAYYNAVWRNTLALTFHDELRESVWPDGGGRWFEVMRRLLAEPNSPWWDDVTTDGVIETRDDILAEAMSDARDELVRRQARRAVDWTWGHQHQLRPARTRPSASPTSGWSGGCSTAAATRSAAAARSSTPPSGTPPPTAGRLRRDRGAVDADGGLPRRPRRVPLGEPDRRVRARVRRALRRPDRPVGATAGRWPGPSRAAGGGRRRGHAHPGPGSRD